MKPIILLSTSSDRLALNHSAGQDVSFVSNAYVDLLVGLGCLPVLVPNGLGDGDVAALLACASGLVLSSGQDIMASQYGQTAKVVYEAGVSGLGQPYRRPSAWMPNPQRDHLESALYRGAVSRALPVLGVCRGMQLINVAEGGTLLQELVENGSVRHGIDADGWINYHDIDILPGTRLHEITDSRCISMSTVHHQGIDVLAPSLVANAYSRDGLIEGLERPGNSFVLGLQGHIEKTLENLPAHLMIWRSFANHATTSRL